MSRQQLESRNLLDKIKNFDPDPLWHWLDRRDILVAAAVIALVLSATFHEIVFSGKTLLATNTPGVLGLSTPYGFKGRLPGDYFRLDPGASAWMSEPLTYKSGEELKDLKLPLWDANMGTGAPLMANIQSAPFNLLKLPATLLHHNWVWDLYLLGRFWLAGMAMYLFCRAKGLALPAGLVASVAYILSGHFILFSNEWWLDVYFTMPLLLWAVDAVCRKPDKKHTTLLVLVIAFNLYCGMPEPSFLTILLAGLYATYMLGEKAYQTRDLRLLAPVVLGLGAGFVLGFMLAAPMLLPFQEYQKESFNIHVGNFVGIGHDPVALSVAIFIPLLNGVPLDTSRAPFLFSGARGYVGLAVPFLAVLGLTHRTLRREAIFFIAIAFFFFLKTYGFAYLNDVGKLPIFDLVGYAQWAAPIIAVGAAIAAGIGVDRIARRPGKSGWSWQPHAALLLTLVMLGGLLHFSRQMLHHTPHQSLIWLEFGVACLILVWACVTLLDNFDGRFAAWGCLLIVAGELAVIAPSGIYRDRFDTFAKPPYVDFLKSDMAQNGRTRLIGFQAVLFPDDASAFDIDDVRALDAVYPKRYLRYVQEFVSPRALDRFVGGPYADAEGLPTVDVNRLSDLMGVGYVLTPPHGGVPGPISGPLADKYGSPMVSLNSYVVDGEERQVLFAHAPTDLPLDVTVGPTQSMLRFSPMMDPDVWNSTTDGVTFQVVADVPNVGSVTLFERVFDPHLPENQHWLDTAVDLSPYMGQAIKLHLKTLPNANTVSDWAGWADLRLTSATDASVRAGQFSKIYDNEVRIYKNRNVIPRAFAVPTVLPVDSGDKALAAMHQPGFEPTMTAIVEKLPDDVQRQLSGTSGTAADVKLTGYDDDRVAIKASMPQAGMVVLTDTYYPGWKAYIDGKETRIYQTDYLFRGVVVPQGDHTIVFMYSPSSFKHGVLLAFLALLALGGWWGYDVYRARRRPAADAGVV